MKFKRYLSKVKNNKPDKELDGGGGGSKQTGFKGYEYYFAGFSNRHKKEH